MVYRLEEFLLKHGAFLESLSEEDLRLLGDELRGILEKRQGGPSREETEIEENK